MSGSLRWDTRDAGPYSARNSSKGALVREACRVLQAFHGGDTLDTVARGVLDATILRQRTRETRRRIWWALCQRYPIREGGWVRDTLVEASAEGEFAPGFLGRLYLHYALRDRLTFDFVTESLWARWQRGERTIARDQVLAFLDEAAAEQPQIRRWAESSRIKLAGNVLSALRDFGVLEGKQKKRISPPTVPEDVVLHVVRVLVGEGMQGQDVLSDPAWRLFLLSEDDVASRLARVADGTLRFERSWNNLVFQVPTEWSSS